MPFFSKVFKGRESSSKKQKKLNGNGHIAPAKPKWSDAWLRTEVGPEEIQELIHGCTNEMKARALDMPFLLLPFRPASDPSAARTFIRHYFSPDEQSAPLRGGMLEQELRLTEPMVLCSVMKWCWSRLPGGVVTWEAYELFKVGEHDSQLARDAFATFIPISVESDARTKIIFDFFDLMAAIAAHGKTNGLTGRKLSRYAGWWAFECSDSGKGFDTGYRSWSKAADATSHLFFAYLRSLSPDSARKNGILALPLSLQTLVQATEYPPEAPSLMQNTTTKVVMIVDAVSPTPFALLRRAKNFEYRNDDRALQQFSEYEDPVKALTDECRRVLKCISSTNQSNVSTSKASTSLKDASWSRFEDIGFGGSIDESDHEDEVDGSALGAKRSSPHGVRSSARSQTHDMGRPTTPSWADFLSSGFVEEDGSKSPGPFLLPPDKQLPPLNAMRVQSSQSHRRQADNNSTLEPGELASINTLDLDDSFWWVWISSLAGEEPTSRKGVFGRCALIETKIPGGKWLILEEQVKGAAPEPAPGAYIAEKKGFLGFTTKKGRLTRRKSTVKKGTLSSPDTTLQDRDGNMSKATIGPDQHARIQAAAAALQEKRREQSMPQNGVRRARYDEASKTNSVFTLQPVIMSEASPAMKWASQYDKNEIRAAYLGNTEAGRGKSSENLAAVANGVKNKENLQPSASQVSIPRPKEVEKDRDLPALPQEPAKASQYDLPAGVSEPAFTPPPLPTTPGINDLPITNQAAAEAAEIPLPMTTPLEKPPVPAQTEYVAPKTPTRDQSDELEPQRTSSALQTTESQRSVSTTPEKGSPLAKRLTKKPRQSGMKGMFGRKKTEEQPMTRQISSENSVAIAAARAALEGRSKQPPNPSPTPSAPISNKTNKSNRFSGLRKKPAKVQSEASQQPIETSPAPPQPIQEEPSTPAIDTEAEREAHSQPPLSSHPPHSRDGPDGPDLSRVNTNERLQADKEFSSFDQGPLADQPAFAPTDSPMGPSPAGGNTPMYEQAPGPTQSEMNLEQIRNLPAPAQEMEGGSDAEPKEAGLTREVSPVQVQDRWAQIRKNAADRAARQSEEQSRDSRRSQTERTDDGETSGEETIESRVARIKARVAELTGNMDSASSSRRP